MASSRNVVSRDSDRIAPMWSIYMDDPVVRQLLPQFAVVLEKRTSLLADAVRAGNQLEVVRLAHIIRGSAGGYGFPGIAEVAGRIEVHATSGRTLTGLTHDVREIVRMAAAVVATIRSLPVE